MIVERRSVCVVRVADDVCLVGSHEKPVLGRVAEGVVVPHVYVRQAVRLESVAAAVSEEIVLHRHRLHDPEHHVAAPVQRGVTVECALIDPSPGAVGVEAASEQ